MADALNSNDVPKSQREMLTSHANRLREFLEITARSLLTRWCDEAGDHNDIPTACVMHSYLALIWQSAPLETLRDKGGAVACMGSAMFVRNWHGFGMGTHSVVSSFIYSLSLSLFLCNSLSTRNLLLTRNRYTT